MSQRSPYADLKSLSDEALVAAVLASQPGAWAAFFARFERLINSCIRRVLLRYGAFHGQEDIEDLVSTTALNLVKDDYKKLRAFDATRGYRLSSWVGLLATNTAHDALRARPPTAYSIDDSEDGRAMDIPTNDADPADLLQREQQVRTLESAVEKLSDTERLFVQYYFEEELEPEQIADLMQISVNTVYSRKNKIREKLRRIVADLQSREGA